VASQRGTSCRAKGHNRSGAPCADASRLPWLIVDVLDGRALDATAIKPGHASVRLSVDVPTGLVTLSSFSLRLTTSHAAHPTAAPQDREWVLFPLVRGLTASFATRGSQVQIPSAPLKPLVRGIYDRVRVADFAIVGGWRSTGGPQSSSWDALIGARCFLTPPHLAGSSQYALAWWPRQFPEKVLCQESLELENCLLL
jgi:hypothetical protein